MQYRIVKQADGKFIAQINRYFIWFTIVKPGKIKNASQLLHIGQIKEPIRFDGIKEAKQAIITYYEKRKKENFKPTVVQRGIIND